jgi:hypothetical protein
VSDRVRSLTLRRAAEIIGGTGELARRLKIAPFLLALLISGVEPTPTDIFLKAVDIYETEMMDSLKKDVD